MTVLTIVVVVALLEAAALLCAYPAIRTARTSQGAVGWVVFLIAAPPFAIPAFLVLGPAGVLGYLAARRTARHALAGLRSSNVERLAPSDEVVPNPERIVFERLAGMRSVEGNAADLLIDGDATFAAIFKAVEAAESYILVEYFTLRDDRIGSELKDRLIARAAAGVAVRVLYDSVGSADLSRAFVDELRTAGVEIVRFHTLRRFGGRLRYNFRTHRKIVIVDGRVAFLGGHNVGDEYLGRDDFFGRWRDTHLRLEGPVVDQVQLVFLEDWHWSTGELLDLGWHGMEHSDNRRALIIASAPSDTMETGSLYFGAVINVARERLWIASPYFVPGIDLRNALKLAALRGVDVRVLMTSKRDKLLVWLAAFAYFDEMRDAGVQIFRYADGFMHQKVVLVDDRYASVGTVNFDNRSCRVNFEVTAMLFDTDIAGEVAQMLAADFAKSELYETPLDECPDWLVRYGAPIARLFSPLL